MKTRALPMFVAVVLVAFAPCIKQSCAQEGGPALQLRPAVFKARPTPTIVRDSSETEPAYDLKYKLAAELTYPSEVTQRLSVQTTISGVKEDTTTNSVSAKSWRIESVDAAGNIALFHQVDSVRMSQRTTGRSEVTYDSLQDAEIPAEYDSLKGTIGVPLTMVVMNSYGRIAKREDLRPSANPGIGDLTLSLPEEPIRVGDSWMVPDEVTVKIAGAASVIKLRYAYSLLNVSAGLATISFRTEILSPIASDPRVMSQLVSRMQKGEIKFDIDDGRPISRKSEIEQDIIGFAGENSSMRYDMRATEEFSNGSVIVASLPKPEAAGPMPAGPMPTGPMPAGPNPPNLLPTSSKAPAKVGAAGKLLPGVSTGADKSGPAPMPTPATPTQGEPTPAEPRAEISTPPQPQNVENSVLATQKAVLGP